MILIFVFHSVKRFAAGRRRNSRGQLMSRTDVERADAAAADAAAADAAAADAAAGAAFLAAGALAVAVAVENGGVGDDDFNKTII